ncbi:alkaline phosphatase PhoX [Guyparkeria sp.]|uniref:alkaline phosphatase PhoX n=1 Tax=Guyparkeria sp. TaxID=2035736 RepID=UPI003970A4B4
MPNERHPMPVDPNRRRLLQRGLTACGVLAVGPLLWGNAAGSPRPAQPMAAPMRRSNIPNLANTLQEIAVENDPGTRMLVPRGFAVREVARTGRPARCGGDYPWHPYPDGGAVFPTNDGGWIYVSNSEVDIPRQGGVGALRFNAGGDLVDSYSICQGTTNNCAGGPTPWGTWLSCEETDEGLVFECDPLGREPAVAAPALGMFKHEAAAVDPVGRRIYLTEDVEDGGFYRFTPDHYPRGGRPDLRSGRLEVAVVTGDDPLQTRPVTWEPVPVPVPRLVGKDGPPEETPTRYQVAGSEAFDGGEGCWYHDGVVYFTTKGDNRVWAVDTVADTIDVVYDKASDAAFNPGIDDVDNLTISAGGDLVVAEDGAEMRLVVVGPDVQPFELVNVLGQRGSEITGPAFSPDGSRLYFSSQKGKTGEGTDGRTYEMRGPFFIDA